MANPLNKGEGIGLIKERNLGGRPKGSQNKVGVRIKDMVEGALDRLGGIDYLVQQGRENPKAFLPLVAKLIPNTLANDPDNPVLGVLHSANLRKLTAEDEAAISEIFQRTIQR